MEGLRGVVLVQTLHYFPFILLNTAAALSALDRSLEEAAQNLGASGFRLFRRVLLPLSLPGYAAGALLTFIRVIDDLGTPLMLNYTKLLAPQAYVRVTTVGLTDVDGYVICVDPGGAVARRALGSRRRLLGRGEFAAARAGAARRRRWRSAPRGRAGGVGASPSCCWDRRCSRTWASLLLSVSKVWSLSPLPGVYTARQLRRDPRPRAPLHLEHAALRAARRGCSTWRWARSSPGSCCAAGSRGRQWLDTIATMPLAIPGVVIAVGYLRVFHGWSVPGLGEPLTSTWLILVIVYAVRRLPYTVRGAYAALQQLPLSLEEAAQNLGRQSRAHVPAKVTLPLMRRGLLAGGLLAFVSSAVDLSSTILLVPRVELGPLSYGIYLYMQSAVGRGPGAALGVVAIVLVAAGTWARHRAGPALRRGALPELSAWRRARPGAGCCRSRCSSAPSRGRSCT